MLRGLFNAARDHQFYSGIKTGWNIYDTSSTGSSSLALTNYDLQYNGQ